MKKKKNNTLSINNKAIFSLLFFSSLLYSCKDDANVSFVIPENVSIQSTSTPVASHKTTAQRKKEADDLRVLYSKPLSQWPKATIDTDNGVEFKEIQSLKNVPFPQDNQYSAERASLGRTLFFDKRLSGSKALSCQTCHDPNIGWADGKDYPTGHEGVQLKRHSPSILNAGYNTVYFWDGRAKSLEEQAIAVLTNPKEMHSTPESIASTLNSIPTYKTKFKQAYGIDSPTLTEVSKAIATFERTVNTKNQSPFDQFINGKRDALSDSALRGMHIFRTTGRCINCHSGSNFTDNKFHNLSLTYEYTEKEDLGLYDITHNTDDWGKFKTPSLRNVANTAPYMHNGVFLTLNKVLTLYNDGMHGKDPHKDPIIRPLGLSDEDVVDLEEFLKALSEPTPK